MMDVGADGRNPAVFLVAILSLIGLAVLFLLVARLRDRFGRARAAELERARREREATEKRLLTEGKHVRRPDGTLGPKCILPTCGEPAERLRLEFVRDDGPVDFIRRMFGAPPRLRVSEHARTWFDRDSIPARYCRTHGELAEQEMRLKLANCERHRTEQLRDMEVDLGHFERVGLEQRLAELVAKHERELGGRRRKEKSNIVPFASSRTGTES
jgi:hypothetical protein